MKLNDELIRLKEYDAGLKSNGIRLSLMDESWNNPDLISYWPNVSFCPDDSFILNTSNSAVLLKLQLN